MLGKKRRLIVALLSFAVISPDLPAALYSDAQLEVSKGKVEASIRAMVMKDIPKRLPDPVKRVLREIGVDLPLRGRSPLDFRSDSRRQLVIAPASSIRFFDDLAILTAWFEHNKRRCDPVYIQSYLYSLLRAHKPLPDPIAAFGLNRKRLLDVDFVDQMSLKITKSGIYFIMAHELGHIYHGHVGRPGGAASIAQEMEADRFALDVLAATGEAPSGAAVFFTAVRWTDPIKRHSHRSTHPLSQRRLDAIGRRLLDNPYAFAHGNRDQSAALERVQIIGHEFVKLGAGLDDDGLLLDLPKGLERDYPVSRFRRACPQ